MVEQAARAGRLAGTAPGAVVAADRLADVAPRRDRADPGAARIRAAAQGHAGTATTAAKEVDRPKGDPPPTADKPAKTETPPTETKAAETKPPEKPQQMAAVAPSPLPPAKPDAPKPDPVPKPAPKPTPAAHQVPRRVEDPANMAPRRGRFPGPAATRDEYLAYMHSLIRQHYNLLSSAELGGRRGMTVIEFVVLDDGKIALVKIRRSSGYPDIDNRIAEMVAAVGHFPPLPQWFQGLAMPFEFGFPFPEALQE